MALLFEPLQVEHCTLQTSPMGSSPTSSGNPDMRASLRDFPSVRGVHNQQITVTVTFSWLCEVYLVVFYTGQDPLWLAKGGYVLSKSQ